MHRASRPSRWLLAPGLAALAACGSSSAAPDDGGGTVGVDAAGGSDAPPLVCEDQCRYVTPEGAGSQDGSDWANACAGFSGPCAGDALGRGNIYLVADGTYPGFTISAPASGDAWITIRKALPDAHGTDTGWTAALGVGQATFTDTVRVSTSYVAIDGAKGPRWSRDLTAYGFRVNTSAGGGATIALHIDSGDGRLSDITFARIAAQAESGDYERYFVAGNDSGAGADRVTVRACYADRWENMVKANAMGGSVQTGWLTEHNVFTNTYSTAEFHGEDINSAYSDMRDWTIRYNWFEGTEAEAPTGCIVVLNGPSQGPFHVYGNVFRDKTVSDGLVGGIHFPMHGTFVHNTIENCRTPYNYANWVIPDNGEGGNDMIVQNNLIANMRCDRGGDGTISHNTYVGCTNDVPTEPSGETLPADPFVDLAGGDLHLATNTSPGAPMIAPYDVDADGDERTTGSRGAFEY